ncbi:phage protease [Paenirhodobacter populi]|uniref:Mu-like prophage I protein n=1 Tax=Paenirhodobacter populi TaxID=2306993 RepID=A0A443JSH6_9RHOB|nr:phage protease [Sinirhodobacter populi]RWR23457.1 hypothetical protein D2T30_03145 [Sinirhodobacter populi]
MTGLAFATCDRALAPGGAAPEWVHLFPPGPMVGRDGRRFDLAEPNDVIADFRKRGVDLPIDYEHQNDTPDAKRNGPVPAAGWKDLRADDTGLWGRVEWTDTAREMIARREYRYLSPSFAYLPESRRIVRVKGAGLVHNPNLTLTALAHEEPDMPAPLAQDKAADPAMLARLASILGLPPDSDPETILAAIMKTIGKDPAASATAAEHPDPARFVPVDAVRELLADRNARIATMREAEAGIRVEAALRDGHITPAMRGWATALCMQDPTSFDDYIAKSPAPYAHLLRSVRGAWEVPEPQPLVASAEATAICAQLGIGADKLGS